MEIRTCPINMHFSTQLKTCVDIISANCKYCEEEIITTIGLCPEIPTCNINETGLTKPYPPECNKYIYCDPSGNSIISRCPIGMHYNIILQYCTSRQEAKCPKCQNYVPTIGICPEIPSCLGTESGITKPYPPNCNKYVYCDQGTSVIRTCPVGMHFNPVLLYCMDAATANCPACEETFTTVRVCPDTPTCSVEEFGMTKPYPPDCSMYLYCNEEGGAELSKCPHDWQFSEQTSLCTSAEEATCQRCEEAVTQPALLTFG